MKTYSIAIDGPAGAGKSTIAKMIARELDYVYVDTGAMYRTYGYYCVKNEIEDIDESICKALLGQIKVEVKYTNQVQHMILNDVDVSEKIRAEEVGNMASKISKSRCLRDHLVEMQRDIAKGHNIVMDGRDIGSNVLIDATLKVYLTASVAVRAKRRCNDLEEKGITHDYSIVKEEIIRRDYNDMNREYAPLIEAEDAVLVDTSEMTIDQVKDTIIELFNKSK